MGWMVGAWNTDKLLTFNTSYISLAPQSWDYIEDSQITWNLYIMYCLIDLKNYMMANLACST